ncbi:MAG: invasion protein CiaB [Campylobacterota bacterium]|nr:invasion protein CiaB [Campylobacterota bacterium]
MTQQEFMKDLQTIYDELETRQAELNAYYDLLDKEKGHEKAEKLIKFFLTMLNVPRDDEGYMAGLTRLVSLREDALEQVMQKNGFDEKKIQKKKEVAYGFVHDFHTQRHESLIQWIEQEQLLTPFYRSLIYGVHYVGQYMTQWQSDWTRHIMHSVNLELSSMFNGDDAKVFEMLQGESLLDKDESGCVGDRCYSVLKKEDTGYKSIAYAEAFPQHVKGVNSALMQLIGRLEIEEDYVFDQKKEWIAYFKAIEEAFAHTVPDELIAKWAEVDRKWMDVKAPLQVGHPLEYYEDHYRKAVALEWDLRIVNPKLQEGSPTKENIKNFASDMAVSFGDDAQKIMVKNLTQVDETQLYIGQPILYYAAEFNGLFSAQVVPNDEAVSAELGKKIFAYADFVMESKKSKPMMKLSVEIMGEAFVKAQRALIESNPKLWHEIYDISTIGHEYGHILWIDSDTESKMNVSGQFKNIEEFKATTGGLMAFFHNERDELKEHVVNDVVARAVALMAWREVGEVLPYYCEGLIHLDILFASGIIVYDNQIQIDYSKYDAMKKAYQAAYKKLAESYLKKEDANLYLSDYATKESGVYLPQNKKIKSFVEHYYGRYKEIGQQTITFS